MFALLLALAVPSLVRAECVAWRQTGQCDPDGPRESGSDLTCNQVVPSGVSGFCDCGNGLRARAVTCDHAPFDCFSQCRAGTSEVAESTPCESADGKCADGSITGTGRHAPQAYTCRAWRQTHGCSANGRRDAASDRGCDDDIDAGASGFCECVGADGRPMNVRLSACDHAVFKCTTECARASHYQCDGWRQTGNCSADGLREPERDLLCSARVPAGVSGFCECGGGRRRVARPPKCSLDVDVASCDDTCRRGEGLYEVLGLAETADEEAREIKQAFRRLSLKLHPDKQRSAEQRSAATIRFAEVREAYDVLSDPDSRILYTMHGHKAASEAKTKKRSGPSTVEMELSMADVYTGAHRTMQISRRVVCKGCRKDDPSAADRARCRRCGECPNEIKPVNVQVAPGFVIQQEAEVPSEERCEQAPYTLDARIRRGMDSGDELTFARAGEQRPGMIPGDVKIRLRVKKNEQFERKGRDLHTTLHVSLREALLGFTKQINHLDGHTVTIKRDGQVSVPGQVLRIAGEGMPALTSEDDNDDPEAEGGNHVSSRLARGRDVGALLVKVLVDFPERLSAEAAEWARNALPL